MIEGAPRAAARTAPTLGGLLRLAWPIVVSRSSQVVVGLADATMVAHLGEEALAATTAGAMNSYAAFILPMGTVFIVGSFSSQLLGRGDLAGARRYGVYGLAVAAFTQLLCFLTIPALPSALGLLDLAPGVRGAMHEYVAVRLLSGGAVVGLEALASYYGGLGNTALPMRAQLAAMLLNVAGNWLLIDGHLGLPAMGVRGAALASALSTGIAFAGLLAVFLAEGRRARTGPSDGAAPGAIAHEPVPVVHCGEPVGGPPVADGGVPVAPGRLSIRELGRMVRFGLPAGFNWFFEFAAFLFFVNVVVAGLGTTTLAALMAVLQVNSVSFMPAFALASAGAILVGQAIGAGAKHEVPRIVGLTALAAACWEGLVGIAYVAIPELLFAPFARGPDPAQAAALLEVGARLLAISAAWQLFDGAAAALGESLRGAGDTAFPMWMRAALAWLVFAPGSWISVHTLGGGALAAMGWLVGYLALLALLLYLRFRSGAWRRIELVEPPVV